MYICIYMYIYYFYETCKYFLLIYDDGFFNRIGLERIGVVRRRYDCYWASLQALDHRAEDRTAVGLVCRLRCRSLLQKKTRKKKGRWGFAHSRSDA